MAHQLRHIRPGVVYEAVRRTRGGRYAFVPSAKMHAELAGIIGEAQRRWPQVKIHQWCWLSTHFHALLSVIGPYAANALAAWMNFVFGESAKVAQALYGLKGEIWETLRCRLIPIEDDAKLLERVTYIMAQATAAGLVARPRQWPGLNTCDALCRGARLRGYLGSAALRRQAVVEKVAMVTIAPAREIHLSPLPTQADWTEYDRQRWYREIERAIIEETAAARAQGKRAGKRYPPPAYYCTVDPNTTKPLANSPAPKFWASADNHEAKRSWRVMMRSFTDAWRDALAAWIGGARACFPPCGWVPHGACYAPSYPQRE